MTAGSGLGRRLAEAMGATGGPVPTDLAGQLAEIQARAGSGRAAARMVGVGDGTWRRWRAAAGLPGGGAGGKPARPSAAGAAKLAAAVISGRVAERAPRVEAMVIRATQRTRSGREDGRQRTMDARSLQLAPGTGEKVAKAYITGGAEAAAVAYLGGVRETSFYRPWLAASVVKDWEDSGYDPEADWWEDVYDYADMDDEDGYGLDVS